LSLKTKQVDGITVALDAIYVLEDKGEAKLLVKFGDRVKDFMMHAIYATNKIQEKNPDAVRRFLMDKGITLARIQSASLGPIKGGDIPDAKKRRVTLRLMVDPE